MSTGRDLLDSIAGIHGVDCFTTDRGEDQRATSMAAPAMSLYGPGKPGSKRDGRYGLVHRHA